MESRRQPNRYLEDKLCEQFQNSLNPQKIQRLWRSFRQTGNSTEGRIQKSSFKKVFSKFGDKNEHFLDNLFERFKMDKTLEGRNDREEVELQDLVVSLAVLARIPYEQKLKFIFFLADVDQDGCLSPEEIYEMIKRIQRNFCKENSYANVESASLLLEISIKKAQRTYKQVMQLLKSNSEIRQEDGLITCEEYIEALKKSEQLFKNEKFLPPTFSLSKIIKNIPSELSLQISDQSKNDFIEFRKKIYNILKVESDQSGIPESKNSELNVVRYPGKIEIVRDQKVVEVLPAAEKKQKNAQKKSNPNKLQASKQKNAPSKINQSDERRNYNEQKSQEQTLEVYRQKLKKMVETKMDPRLNLPFDLLIKHS